MEQTQTRLGDALPVIVWDSVEYALVPGSAQRRSDLASGGLTLNADFSFEALVSTFLDGDIITDAKSLKGALLNKRIAYLDDGYKVDAVTIWPGGLQIKAECSSINQNA